MKKISNNVYVEAKGTVFAIVGTGGQELHGLDDQAYFTANQFEDYGFLELTIKKGTSIIGQFYSNDGNIIKDKFIIEKKSSSSISSINKTVGDNMQNNNPVMCKKLASFANALMDEWEQGQLSDEQALIIGEQAKKLITESGCPN